MEEPVVETMQEKSSNLPFIIGAAVAVVLVVVAWFWVLWPEGDEADRVAENKATSTAEYEKKQLDQVTNPIVVISESDGVISAREVRPLRLDSGQYIYVVPFETPNRLVKERRETEQDNNRVFGYTYVPEY